MCQWKMATYPSHQLGPRNGQPCLTAYCNLHFNRHWGKRGRVAILLPQMSCKYLRLCSKREGWSQHLPPLNFSCIYCCIIVCIVLFWTGGEALVSCGLMESLLKVIEWPGEEDCITVRSKRLMFFFYFHHYYSCIQNTNINWQVAYCSIWFQTNLRSWGCMQKFG